MSYLTKQQIFDNAYIGVLKHGLSYVTTPMGADCRYRASSEPSDPCRCSIGHSIPDEMYNAGLEDSQVTIPNRGTYLEQLFSPNDTDFLSDVMRIHDDVVAAINDGQLDEKDMASVFTPAMERLAVAYEINVPTGDTVCYQQ